MKAKKENKPVSSVGVEQRANPDKIKRFAVLIRAPKYRTFDAKGRRVTLQQNQKITHPWPSLLEEARRDVQHRCLVITEIKGE